MAIRALMGFNHLEGVVAWGALLDHGLTFNTPTPNVAVADGYLGVSTAGTPQYILSLDAGTLIDPAATKYTIGMRLKTYQAGALGTAANAIGPGFGTTGQISQLGGLFQPLATVGGTVYVEFEVDLVSGVVRRWVDNVETTSVTISLATTKQFRIVTGWGDYTTYRMLVKDMYLLDNVAAANDDNVSRLSPQVLVPIVSSAADGPNWTTNSGTLVAAVNPAPGEAPITNKATSPLTRDNLTLTLAATIPPGAKINAVDLSMGGKSLGSGPALMGTKLVQGGNEKVGTTVSIPQTQTYNGVVGTFAKAPDGAAWDSAKLNATSLVISPDVAG